MISSDHCRYGAHVAAQMMQKALSELCRPWRREPGGHCLSPMEVFRLAAEPLGIEVHDLGCDAFELRHGGRVRRFLQMAGDHENAFTFWVTGHKYMTFELLRRAGVEEIPHYRVFSMRTAEEARREFRERARKVVVKPCYGTSGGKGVTVGVTTERELNRAMFAALCHDRQFLIEDFVPGGSFRVLVSRGRLLSAVERIPPGVTGDGTSSLRELIDRENERRAGIHGLAALCPIRSDADLVHCLSTQGKSLRTVPARGERVLVKSISNFSSGGETEDVTDRVHEDTVELCRRVTAELRIRLAGIDLLTTDISRPLRETGGVINEVNTSPQLNLHYAARNATRNANEVRDVAREILLDMFPRARPAA